MNDMYVLAEEYKVKFCQCQLMKRILMNVLYCNDI